MYCAEEEVVRVVRVETVEPKKGTTAKTEGEKRWKEEEGVFVQNAVFFLGPSVAKKRRLGKHACTRASCAPSNVEM